MNPITRFIQLILLVFGITWSQFSFSAPTTWALIFFDGYSVSGSGHFVYDTATTECIEKGFFPQSCSSFVMVNGIHHTILTPCSACTTVPESGGYFNGFDIASRIDTIEFNLGGFAWGTGSGRPPAGKIWWDGLGIAPGIQSVSQYDIDIQSRWLFYDDPLTQFELVDMSNFSEICPLVWKGSWLGRKQLPSGAPTSFGSGDFLAIRVPIIPSILGCISPTPPVSDPDLPSFSSTTRVLDLPTVLVDDIPFSGEMQLLDDPKQILFKVTEVGVK